MSVADTSSELSKYQSSASRSADDDLASRTSSADTGPSNNNSNSHEPNPELDNFLSRVDEISEIIHGLVSNDSKVQAKALMKADLLIRDREDGKIVDIDNADDGDGDGSSVAYKIKSNRTVINKANAASEEGQGDMSQAAFMKMVEKDANERARDRQERKERSDELRKAGNVAFRKQNWAEALDNYNKAIALIKDSPCLYNNRALTFLRIGIYSKAIEDCDSAIYLAKGSMKAHLLKAKAYFLKEEPGKCREWLDETRHKFPNNTKMIDEYQKELFEMRFLEVEVPRHRKSTKSVNDEKIFGSVGAGGDEVWRRAARHEILATEPGDCRPISTSATKQSTSESEADKPIFMIL